MRRGRYFANEKASKPGIISDDLREALNLHPNKLPPWIYKMRVLGYPPGWLQRANISNSSLEFFDDDNQKPQSEEGQQGSYNPDCLEEFPGYNVPVPEGIDDECMYFGMPPLSECHQLSFIKPRIPTLKPTPYKRIKLSDSLETPASPEEKFDSSPDDCFLKRKIPNTPSPDPSPPESVESGEIPDDEDDDVMIIEQISNQQQTPKKTPSNKHTHETKEKSKTPQKKIEKIIPLDRVDGITSPKSEKSLSLTPQSGNGLKLIAMGSPVPATLNNKRPPLENFAAGMGELIYFENLPTSTGVFDKMRKVIHKVRKEIG